MKMLVQEEKQKVIELFNEKFSTVFEQQLMEEINQNGNVHIVGADDVLIEYGQKMLYMPIVVDGLVRVMRMDDQGKELLLYYVNTQESCAMSFTCCMQEVESEVRAVAEEETSIIKIPIHVMDEWLVKYPTWKSFVMKTIKMRFNEMLKAIDQVAFMKLDDRLIQYLKEKSDKTGSKLINLSHEQIANEMATSRVVISRLLKKLEADGRLLLYRNQLKLLGAW
ncbi:MAG: Crp/Fnr family transcriptional regulator [Cytophagales bacterium]